MFRTENPWIFMQVTNFSIKINYVSYCCLMGLVTGCITVSSDSGCTQHGFSYQYFLPYFSCKFWLESKKCNTQILHTAVLFILLPCCFVFISPFSTSNLKIIIIVCVLFLVQDIYDFFDISYVQVLHANSCILITLIVNLFGNKTGQFILYICEEDSECYLKYSLAVIVLNVDSGQYWKLQ